VARSPRLRLPGLKPLFIEDAGRWAEAQRFHGNATCVVCGEGECRRDAGLTVEGSVRACYSHFMCKVLTTLVLIACFYAVAQEKDPPKLPPRESVTPAQITSRLVSLTRAWLDGSLSAGGLKAEFREVGRSRENGRLKAVYNVYVRGGSPDKLYSLLSWPVEGKEPAEVVKGASVTSAGLLVCGGRSGQCGSAKSPDDPIKFTLTPHKGEITRLALLSSDKSSKVTFGIIPDPVTATEHGCTIEVVRLAPKFEAAMIQGRGFKPGEPIEFSAKSYSESEGGPVKADEKGEVAVGVTPFVKGKTSGTTVVKLITSHCAPETSFTWGR
jgi:hypothetical protein